MMKRVAIVFFVFVLSSCGGKIDANENLTAEQYDQYLKKVAPYCIKKPDFITYEQRMAPAYASFYDTALRRTNSTLDFFVKNDTANFFFFQYKDLSSLYEHYRGIGGYFKTDANDSITFMNLLYHTPRFTKEEMEKKSNLLFNEMFSTGNVNQYIGNKKYIQTPNADFYYDTKRNRWDYTENSSWKFLEKAREDALRKDSVPN